MYKHITKEERASIALLVARKKSFAYIANEIGVHRTTVAREYHRNKERDGKYYARKAQKHAVFRNCGKQEKHKIIESNQDLYDYVVKSLEFLWSPEQMFAVFPCETITYDNGSEFAAFEKIEEDIGAEVYFAYPGKPQQRGCNENCNGLLRQFFPKGSSFGMIGQRDVESAVVLINNRPRKRLGYRTPLEVFVEELG